jgi:hypothetical protein
MYHQATYIIPLCSPYRRSRRSRVLKLDRLVHQKRWTGLLKAGGPGGPAHLDRLFGTLLDMSKGEAAGYCVAAVQFA